MDEKYLKFSVEELIQDRGFVSWIIHQNKNEEWQEFASRNPEFDKTAKAAKKIIHLLEDSYDILSEDDVYRLWTNINRFDHQQKQQPRVIRLKRVFRYAAVGLFAVAIFGLSAIYYFNLPKTYQFSDNVPSIKLFESQLILSNGEQINLKKDHSIVEMKDEKIQINNDSIINIGSGKRERSKLNEVIVSFGKRSQLVLDDGTKVWLNAGSRLAFPSKFDSKVRTVYLEGEAYFEVAHNDQQPFYVNVKDIEIRVLGTKFNVSAYSTDALVETVLLEGKVAINETGNLDFLNKEVFLKPNQKASYNKEKKTTLVMNEADADISIAWVNGWFSFSQQTLVDVLKKLERYYNVKFEYDACFPSEELITGKMDLKDSLDEVLIFLSDLAKVEFRADNDKIFVERGIKKVPVK